MNERYARQSFLGPRSEEIFKHCRACIGVGDCDATERSSAKHVRTLSLGKISDVATVVKAGL